MIILRPFEQERFRRLVELARDRFDANLPQAEASVMMYSAAAYPLPEPPATEPRPPVRTDFLRWLMTDSEAAKFIDPKGIRLGRSPFLLHSIYKVARSRTPCISFGAPSKRNYICSLPI
jgi:hypothetical protein